jgi:hypothetical protein
MKIEEMEREALALPERDRVTLLSKLLATLSPADTQVADEVVEQRERDLASGQVAAISQAEFVRRVQANRGE